MLLNVLIADDEFFIRQRLKKIIDWDRLGLCCLGEVENGNEAIDFVSRHRVDILLLDIKMPVKSGIEVLEYIYQHAIPTKILFLSGYNDFEYAQKAVNCQAVNYLLKPIDEASLEHALTACRDRILSELKKQSDMEKYDRYLRRSFLYKVAAGGREPGDLYREYPDFAAYSHSCYLGVFCSEGLGPCMDRIQQMKSDGRELEFFQESEHTAVLQFYFGESAEYKEAEAFCRKFLSVFPGYVFLSLGEVFPMQAPWPPQYQAVFNDLTKRYFHTEKALVKQQNSEAYKIEKETFLSLRQNIILYLNSKNKAALEILLDQLFDDIAKSRNPNQLNLIVTEILIIYNVHCNDSFLPNKNVNTFARELIDDGYSLNMLKKYIKSYGLECMDHISFVPSDVVLVKKITEYISGNYTSPELSVSQISDIFNLNPVYLGSVFKRITGQSIVQYITFLRMEKAKELLNAREYKIIQVAEMVGYSDVFYFSKKFKKVCGCSPREYCNSEEI